MELRISFHWDKMERDSFS